MAVGSDVGTVQPLSSPLREFEAVFQPLTDFHDMVHIAGGEAPQLPVEHLQHELDVRRFQLEIHFTAECLVMPLCGDELFHRRFCLAQFLPDFIEELDVLPG